MADDQGRSSVCVCQRGGREECVCVGCNYQWQQWRTTVFSISSGTIKLTICGHGVEEGRKRGRGGGGTRVTEIVYQSPTTCWSTLLHMTPPAPHPVPPPHTPHSSCCLALACLVNRDSFDLSALSCIYSSFSS